MGKIGLFDWFRIRLASWILGKRLWKIYRNKEAK